MTAEPEVRPGMRRPGGRTARTKEAVAVAVTELIAEGGVSAPSFAEVASRSGVAATTLYRRWRTPQILLLDVLGDGGSREGEVEITGDLHADLLANARRLVSEVTSTDGLLVLQAVIRVASEERESAAADALVQRRLDTYRRILEAASEEHLTLRDVLDGLIAPVYFHAMLGTLSTDDTEIRVYVDNLIRLSASRALDDDPAAPR